MVLNIVMCQKVVTKNVLAYRLYRESQLLSHLLF